MKFFERDAITNNNIVDGHTKNFLWFSLKSNSYERLNERDRAYYYQYRWNLLYNLNIRMFFLSTFDQHFDDDLSIMIINKGDWFRVNAINFMDEITVDKIVQRIMQTPKPMHIVNDCQNENRTEIIERKFLLGKNRKQYWVLYPKYFLNSRLVHFKVSIVFSEKNLILDYSLVSFRIRSNAYLSWTLSISRNKLYTM